MKKIKLTKGYFALVDDEDFDLINELSWHYQPKRKTGYAIGHVRKNGVSSTRRMHRVILKAKIGEIVDHINGNGLDNRKENLRIVSNKENCINRRSSGVTGFKGVSFNKVLGLYVARIGPREKHVLIGKYLTKEEAAVAYDIAALKMYGDIAVTNFNKENYK